MALLGSGVGSLLPEGDLRSLIVDGVIGGVGSVVRDGVDGLLVEQEAAAIADRICALLLDERRADAMGAAGREKAQSRFTWPLVARRTEEAYRRALS